MEKNNKPTGEQYGVSLAVVDELKAFTTIHQTAIVSFKNNGGWEALEEVPGTLVVISTPSDGINKIYSISATFRIAFSTIVNQATLDRLSKQGLILRYNTGGGKIKIAGTKSCPLRFKFSTVEGFDGYECTLTGTQTQPESFMNS